MTVGYAAFQKNLNIKGTSKISSNWDIRITNVTTGNKTGNGENAKTPTWTNLTASMEANLYEKGDAMEYEVTVENKGTFDAKLENILTNIKSNNEAIKISFSGYTKGEKLYKNTSKVVNVKIEYNKDFEGTPPSTSSEVEITLDYGQAEGGTIKPTNDYLVTYDYKTNGGTSSTSQNEYLSEGSKIDLSYTATKAGWTFAGWNTNKDATSGLSSLEMKNADVTLYAIYKKTINVSYSKSSEITSIGKTTDSCIMYNLSSTCQITLPSITASSGYGVDGWYNGNTKAGVEGNKYSISGTTALTAKGKANSYTLTYNYNGATSGNSTTSKSVTYNSTYGTLPSPTRSYVVTYNYNGASGGNSAANATSNYTFNGWYKETAFTNQVTSTTVYNIAANSTIYAKWTSTSVTLPSPSKTGYSFGGWYSDSSLTNKVGEAGGSYIPTSNQTLYAKWNINSYNVTYNYSQNGGTSSTKTTATVNYGSSIDLTPTATKSGWTFVGWNTNKDATSGLNSLNMSTSNVTLYAIYRKEAVTLTAKFNSNGATLSSTSNLTCTLPAVYNNASQSTSCTVTAPTITRSGYNIIGFNTSASSTANNGSYNTSTKVLTLMASNNNATWYGVTSKAVTITFNKNGASTQTNASGTAVSDTTVTRTCTMYNTETTCSVTSPTIVGSSNTPTVVGYNTATSSTTSAWNQATAKAVSANATYYAVTRKDAKTITVSFNANGASSIGSTSQSCTIPAVYNGASQATTCNITSPTITAPANTPTVIGWSTAAATHSNQWSVNIAKAVSSNATYYAQTTKAAKTITITFNKNGASTQTNASGTAVSDATVTRACTIGATYNGTAQATTCSVTSPTIVGASGFGVIGYNTAAGSTTSAWNQATAKAVSANGTYYAVTKSTAAYTATFNANGATSIGSSSLSCYRYNGASSCNVTAPSITRSGFTITGWNTSASATTSSLNVGAALALTSNPTYYAITSKAIVVTFTKGANVSAVGATSGTCTIQNTATSCSVATPSITPSSGYTSVGWSTASGASSGTAAGSNITGLTANATYYANTLDKTPPTISEVYTGAMVYKDPNFSSGNNSIGVYNNSANGTVTHARQALTNPAGSYALKITTAGTATPGLGGFYFGTPSAANKIMVTRILAKIPVGYSIAWASNATGDNRTATWLTPTAGTGDWQEYVCRVTSGATGTFSTTNFYYLNGAAATAANPVTWYVGYATVYSNQNYYSKAAASFKADDAGSGIAAYGINQSSTAEPSYTSVTNVKTVGRALENLTANGTYYIWVKDSAGNKANKAVAVSNIDTTKPTVSLNPSSQASYVSGGKAVTVNLADAHSGLKASQPIYYAWSTSNTTAPTTWSSVTSTNANEAKNASVTVPATSSASLTGTYYLWIKAGTVADVSGNTSAQVVSSAFKFDNTNPTVSVSTSKTTKSITAVATSSATSGISKYEFSKDNGTTWVNNGTSNTYTFTGLTHNTAYNIKSRVTSGVSRQTISATVATITNAISTPTYKDPNNGEITITYPAGCGSTYTCSYSQNGGSYVNVTSSTPTVVFTSNGTLIAKVSDGTNTITASTYSVILPNVSYSAHIANDGWLAYVSNGATAGTTGQSKEMQALKIKVTGLNTVSGGITYSAHVQNIGWQSFVSNDAIAGTTGESRQMEAIKIELTGGIANYYDVYYRAHVASLGWLDWTRNGNKAGTESCNNDMQAIQIKLVKKGSAAPGATANPYKACSGPAQMSASATGNQAGPGPSYYRVVAQARVNTYNMTQAYLQYRYYIEVYGSNADFFGTSVARSWGGNVSLHAGGTYGDSGWVNYGWVNYGTSKTFSANASYTGSKYHNSSASVTIKP
ncbi:MAG: InlB B-repeat-containing protein [Bacilli bacterium]